MTRSLASTVTDIAEAGRAGRALFLTAAECRDLAGLIANGRVAEFRLAAHVVHFALESPADADFGDSLASQVRDLAPVIPSSLADRTVASGCEAVMDTAGGPDLSVVTDSPYEGRTVDVAALAGVQSPISRRPEFAGVTGMAGRLSEPIEDRDSDRGEAADESGTTSDRGAGPSRLEPDYEVWEWDDWPSDTLVLIACSAEKHPSKCSMIPELRYTSSLFAMALRAARALTEDRSIRVLSAHYGLISLGTFTKPYDVRIGDKRAVKAEAIRQQSHYLPEHSAVVSLMPHDYTDAARAAFPDLIDAMHGVRGIGDIRHRLALIAQLDDDTPRPGGANK